MCEDAHTRNISLTYALSAPPQPPRRSLPLRIDRRLLRRSRGPRHGNLRGADAPGRPRRDRADRCGLHRTGPILAFGRLDKLRPGYRRAIAIAREHGYEPIERLAGGRAAVFHEGSVSFSRATREFRAPTPARRPGSPRWPRRSPRLWRRSGSMPGSAGFPASTARATTASTARGAVKLAGIGQRVITGGAHIGGVIVSAEPGGSARCSSRSTRRSSSTGTRPPRAASPSELGEDDGTLAGGRARSADRAGQRSAARGARRALRRWSRRSSTRDAAPRRRAAQRPHRPGLRPGSDIQVGMAGLGTFISAGARSSRLERVRLAESLGYDSTYVTHIAGRDSLTVLAAYAAATERIRLGTGVLPIYSRTPVATAQTAATIDEISGGRMVLGLGVSHKVTVEKLVRAGDRPAGERDARVREGGAVRCSAARIHPAGRGLADRFPLHGLRGHARTSRSTSPRSPRTCSGSPVRSATGSCSGSAIRPTSATS